MSVKQFQFHSDARQSILRGARVLADCVRMTLGPQSKSVLVEKKFGRPIVCDDGDTIAKEVELENPEEDLGAQMIREAAERTGDAVGDGTTTSTLLAHAILAEGVRNVASGASAVDLKRGLARGLKAAVESLRELSRPVTNKREKAQVATVSAHGDSLLGNMVAEALEKVGAEGAIAIEESKTTETTLEVIEGMQFDRRHISPYVVTNPEAMENSALDGGVVVDHMRSGKGNLGLDAATGKYVDRIEAGIIDATKVVRVALETAVSLASTLLLTDATLTEKREKKPERIPRRNSQNRAVGSPGRNV